MKHINTIILCRDNYDSQVLFENEIKKAVMLLLNANCIMIVKYDYKELGVVCIEFSPANQEFGCDYPRWLSPTEYESVVWDKEIEEENEVVK